MASEQSSLILRQLAAKRKTDEVRPETAARNYDDAPATSDTPDVVTDYEEQRGVCSILIQE